MTDHIKVLTHSSIRIAADEGIIYFDPFNVEGKPADADYIFITHDHYDHFSPDDIIHREEFYLIHSAASLKIKLLRGSEGHISHRNNS